MTPWHHVTPMFMFFCCTSGCPRKLTRWQKFMDSLKLDERVDFEQGDIGLAGGRGKVRVNLPTICSKNRVKTALKGSSLNGFKVLKFLDVFRVYMCSYTATHFAKTILFELCRQESSIFSFKVSKLNEVSHEMFFWRFKLSSWEVILAFCVAGAILRSV